MEFFETDDEARSFAKTAIGLMDQLGVAPNPKNFAVWYAYCTKQYADLNHAIDSILKKTKKLSPKHTDEIYQTFFGADIEGSAIRDTSRNIQGALTQILDVLAESGKETAEYGQTLQDFSGRLSDAPQSDDLRGLVDGLLGETRKMEQHSRKVEDRLRTSSQEVGVLRSKLEMVQQEALTDGLTGISNRKSFDRFLRETANESEADETPLCLLMCDIDHFKKFNDTWGHQFGDQVLRLVAKTLVECIKGRDLAARYGGEEFAIVLPQTGLKNAVTLAENIRAALATKKVVKRSTGEDLGTVTMSIGAAEYRSGETLSKLVGRADTALYGAKQGGRNRVLSEEQIKADTLAE